MLPTSGRATIDPVSRFSRDLVRVVPPRESAVLDEDGVAEHLLRTSRYDRTSRGLYVPGGTTRSPAQRIVCAAALLPRGAAIGGWAAGHVHGADLLDGLDRHRAELPVDVLLPPGLHRLALAGVRYRRVALGPDDAVWHGDLRVTSPLRTAVDLACWAGSTVEATVVLDLMLGAGLGLEELRAVRVHARRGAVAARAALDLVRPGSRSPGETRLRLLYLEEVGHVPVLLNPTLLDTRGNVVAMPDLFDEEAGLALEYDGASWDSERALGHRDARQHREDNAREEEMERLGVRVVRAGADDLGAYRRQTSYRLGRARADGLSRDRGGDRWIVRRGLHDR